jgi:hypothetical protein
MLGSLNIAGCDELLLLSDELHPQRDELLFSESFQIVSRSRINLETTSTGNVIDWKRHGIVP